MKMKEICLLNISNQLIK